MRENRHAQKRRHKREMKKKYAKKYFFGGGRYEWNELMIAYRDTPRDRYGRHPLDYWKSFYLTGPRQYAKNETNSQVRRESREIARLALLIDDIEDFDFLSNRNATYRKQYDYEWTLW